jgi:hypothetical protein
MTQLSCARIDRRSASNINPLSERHRIVLVGNFGPLAGSMLGAEGVRHSHRNTVFGRVVPLEPLDESPSAPADAFAAGLARRVANGPEPRHSGPPQSTRQGTARRCTPRAGGVNASDSFEQYDPPPGALNMFAYSGTWRGRGTLKGGTARRRAADWRDCWWHRGMSWVMVRRRPPSSIRVAYGTQW